MNIVNVHTVMNTNETGDYDSSSGSHINDSTAAQDQIVASSPFNSTLDQALITYVQNTNPNTIQQQETENDLENLNPLNTSSRVSIFVGKYPSDATLRDYADLQMWMYIHGNKHAPVDICESLNRILLLHADNYDHHTLFNVYLICAETYQTVGNVGQAHSEYGRAETIRNLYEIDERDRKRKKLEEIGMKLKFQSKFQDNLIEGRTRHRFNLTPDDFLKQLNMDNPSSEQCRSIWRQVVLQSALNPDIAVRGAQWLLSYAYRFHLNTLSHANSLYVALNLFLFGYGPNIFQNRMDVNVFQILNRIAHYFEENGNQSKQFSPIHKMSHVWGTAAVAFHLVGDQHKYLVCASMMRVSFESLGIYFPSSGIESLFILAREHTPNFLSMMTYSPSIKLTSPDCINYFRRKLETTVTSIRYSSEIVDQFVTEVFNIDVTDHRI